MSRKQQNNKENKPPKPPLYNYARYTGIGFQMAATIALGVFGGLQIDKWLELRFPVFTLILSLLSVGIAIYQAIKDFLK